MKVNLYIFICSSSHITEKIQREINGAAFWKCWRSKFETASKCVEVEQCRDPNNIANKFACHFSNDYKANYNEQQAESLHKEYVKKCVNYCGMNVVDKQRFDTKLVSNVILRLHRVKLPIIRCRRAKC